MRLIDAWTLAATKLRARKTRTIVTATLSSLLFAILILAFTVVHGAIDSYERFSKDGLSNRYITNIVLMYTEGREYNSSELIVKAKARNQEIVAQKKVDAKRLGITYDATLDPSPTTVDMQGGGEYLNETNFATRQVIQEALAERKTSAETVRELAAQYSPKAQYAFGSVGDTNGLTVMVDGKEPAKVGDNNVNSMPGQSTTLGYLSRAVVDSFIVDDADLSVVKDATAEIPVIAPYKEIEKALGLKSLPKTATNQERLVRLDQVKKRASSVRMPVCYRNDASRQLLDAARLQIDEMEKRKNDKTYEKPAVQYALPDRTTCGPVTITKDTRPVEEKRYAAKQLEFDLKYGIEQEPLQKKIVFRVVGISPDIPDFANIGSLDMLAMMIGGSSLQGQWVIPTELVDSSVQQSIIPPQVNAMNSFMMFNPMEAYDLVEFSNAEDAKRFIAERGCDGMDCGTKPYISYFGSNSVLIDNATEAASKTLGVAGVVVTAIAALLMMGMIGRVITDSRRETAVFRAIGAKRNDIRAVYTLYVITFSLIVALVAVVLGVGLALFVDTQQSEALTASARLMFIQSREAAPFSLVGVWPEALLLTVGVVLLSGFTAMLLPLARNLARNPLKDMRDE